VDRPPIFTIGHSNRSLEELVEALRKYRITVVIDVRTKPASGRHAQFNRAVLENHLPTHGFTYLYLGEALGAFLTESEALNPAGQVWYRNVREMLSFKTGIRRVEAGVQQGYRMALMCAEGNPHECHRFPMIAYQLVSDGFEVQHILRNGTAITHTELENELLEHFAETIPHSSLFQPNVKRADQLEAAYDQLNLQIVRRLASRHQKDDADAS
jgi:uncharacterized protein (DUF488 family)